MLREVGENVCSRNSGRNKFMIDTKLVTVSPLQSKHRQGFIVTWACWLLIARLYSLALSPSSAWSHGSHRSIIAFLVQIGANVPMEGLCNDPTACAAFLVSPRRARRPLEGRAKKRMDEFLLQPWELDRVNSKLQSLGLSPYKLRNEVHGRAALGSDFWSEAPRHFARGHIVGVVILRGSKRLVSSLQLRNEDLKLMFHMQSTPFCSDLCVVDVVGVACLGQFADETSPVASDHAALLPMAERTEGAET